MSTVYSPRGHTGTEGTGEREGDVGGVEMADDEGKEDDAEGKEEDEEGRRREDPAADDDDDDPAALLSRPGEVLMVSRGRW